MNKKSLQVELTVILVLVAFLGMSAVFVLSYYAMRNNVQEELLAKTRNLTEIEAGKINSWFENQITFTDALGTALTQLNSKDQVLQILKAQAKQNAEYLTIFVGLSDNTGVFSDNWPAGTGPTPDIWPETTAWKATQRGWYKSAMEGKGKVIITAPYQDALTASTVITVTKDIGKFDNLGAAVGIDVDVTTVVEAISKVETLGGYAFLVDQDGHIVAHPNDQFAPKGDDYKFMSDVPVYAAIFPATKKEYSMTDYDGVNRYFFPCQIAASGWTLYAAIPRSAVTKAVNPDAATMVTAGIFIIVAAFVVNMVIRRKVVLPLIQVVRAGERIAHGDLNIDLNVKSQNELGQLAKQFGAIVEASKKQAEVLEAVARQDFSMSIETRDSRDTMNIAIQTMIATINGAIRDISENVGQVSTGAGEVSNAAQNLSDGSQKAAASLEEISASMSEISGKTKKNAESASQARDLTQQTNKVAADGQKAMQDMVTAMDQITKNSGEIQRVIKVIDDIAFQTNLLALNAAVEAARAGQHGKGFAVVAEEVRNLASRSAKAAQETSALIANSGAEIERGGIIASKTADVLKTIVEQIKKTTDLVAEIAVASNEQAHGVGQVTSGLQQIDSVTQQNTAVAEESASAASEMSSMAENLQKLVAQFKLRGQTGMRR